jgi:hypothetical protein
MLMSPAMRFTRTAESREQLLVEVSELKVSQDPSLSSKCRKKVDIVLSLRRLDFAGPNCLFDELFGIFVGVRGVLVRLSGQFVSREMISFAVSDGGGSMGVSRKVVEFCGSVVSALWHIAPVPMVCLKAIGLRLPPIYLPSTANLTDVKPVLTVT